MPIAEPVGEETLETLFVRLRRTGDPEVLGRVFDRTSLDLFRISLTLTPDAASAEDAVQETYLAVMEHLDRYDPARPARPWLLGILRMKVREVRRRAERAPDAHRLPPALLPVDPAEAAASAEERRRVREALEALHEPYRSVAILRWRYGLEPAEIAHARDESPGTVRSLLHRAMDILSRSLGASPAVLLERTADRGLHRVREAVVARARVPATVRIRIGSKAALPGSLAAGGILMSTKKVVAGAVALLLLGGLCFMLRQSAEISDRRQEHASTSGSQETASRSKAPEATVPASAPEVPLDGTARAVVVRDALTSSPLPGVEVVWRVGTASGKGTTGPDGTLQVRGVPEGDATLEARKDEFESGTLGLKAGTWNGPAEILLAPGMAEARRRFVAAARRREEFLRHSRVTMWTLSWDTKGEHLFQVDRAIADMDGDQERWTRTTMVTKAEALDLPSDATQVSAEIAERVGPRNPGVITIFDGKREMAAYLQTQNGTPRWSARTVEKSDFYFRHGAMVWSDLREESAWMSELAGHYEVRLCQPLEGGRVHWLFTFTSPWGAGSTVWIQRVETAGGNELLPVLSIGSRAAGEDLDAVLRLAASDFTALDAREEFVWRKTVEETDQVSGILLPARALGEAGYAKSARTRYWLSYEPRVAASWPEGYFDLDRNPNPSLATEGELWNEGRTEHLPLPGSPR